MNLGKVVPGYTAHHWFGRPLLLSNAFARSLSKGKLGVALDSELALGCDGFVFRTTAGSSAAPLSEQLALFDDVLKSYSRRVFVYAEAQTLEVAVPLADLLRRHTFPSGYMVASKSPDVLRELFRLDPDFPSKMALMVGVEKELSGLMRCPYTTVEIPDALATHERILQIHSSLKEVFVRATFGKAGAAADEREFAKLQKRARWLAHEGVDAIITDRVGLLRSALGLDAGAA